MDQKSALRSLYKEKRKALSNQAFLEKNQLLLQKILNEPFVENCQNFHVFLPIKAQKEVDTSLLIEKLWEKGKTVVVPKTDFSTHQMHSSLLFNFDELEVNEKGIPEPKNILPFAEDKIDLVFVPLLAADIWGNRVGYGGGFYDRFLAKLNPNCQKVGLSLFEPISEKIATEETDISLDAIIYP
ncbi:MAG: 5-formyltetrahydrofolate cyclo-ligase [Flavobacteriaceae bacterium]|nr:MAG: 5-formyltetrahydrofolate cyclo-ligase [Flavobacteriaceae bacterium]